MRIMRSLRGRLAVRIVRIALVVLVVALLIRAAYTQVWTGFGPKTLWDWMELFIVSLVLAGGALWFNTQERKAERKTANERQWEAALQSYLDQMAKLLLGEELLEKKDAKGEPVFDVAQVRTTTALRTLNGGRRNIVFQFIRDADLAGSLLVGASLSEADLHDTDLRKISLRKAKLRSSNLSGANLNHANLSEANLNRANLSGAHLLLADLTGANLNRANLSGAHLLRSNLSGADLTLADLTGADLSEADLSGADLSGANVADEELKKANILPDTHLPHGTKHN